MRKNVTLMLYTDEPISNLRVTVSFPSKFSFSMAKFNLFLKAFRIAQTYKLG